MFFIVLLVLIPAGSFSTILVVPITFSSEDNEFITLDQCVYQISDEDSDLNFDVQQALQNVSINNSTEEQRRGNEAKVLADLIAGNKYRKICKSMKIRTIKTDLAFDNEYIIRAIKTSEPILENVKCNTTVLDDAGAELATIQAQVGALLNSEFTTQFDSPLLSKTRAPHPEQCFQYNLTSYPASKKICKMSDLHKAILGRNISLVRKLVANGADMNAQDCQGLTPLHLAIETNNQEVLPALAHCTINSKESEKGDQHILHLAVTTGNKAMVEILIALGVEVDGINKKGLTPLQEALLNNKSDVIHVLVNNGANVNARTSSGDNSVHLLSETDNIFSLVLLKHFGLLHSELVNSVNNQGETPITKAVKGNHPRVLKFLLSIDANTSAKNQRNESYVHVAVRSRSTDALEVLLKHCLPPDEMNDKEITPLLLAVKNDDTLSMKILSSYGADIHTKFSNKSLSLLHEAAKHGSLKALEWLFQNGLSLKERDGDQWTALHTASWNGHILVVVYLLEKGAQVDNRDKDDWTPLHMAAWKGHLTVLRELLHNGANIHAKEKDDWMSIHMAARNGHLLVVQSLLSNGAMIDSKEKDGWTPLHLSANMGQLEVVKELLSNNAAIDARTNNGSTALHFAARSNQLPVLKELIRYKADVSAKDNDCWTPLQTAAYHGHALIVQELLSMGADVNVRDADSWTPMHLAANRGWLDIVQLLLKKGANINELTKSGHTPLYYAYRNNHSLVAKLLAKNGARKK